MDLSTDRIAGGHQIYEETGTGLCDGSGLEGNTEKMPFKLSTLLCARSQHRES